MSKEDRAGGGKKADYKASLNLPQTSFPMQAQLNRREPEFLQKWESMDLHRRIRERAVSWPKFVLHDGPPYANGNIHMGTALNKILKDIIVKSRFLEGYDSVYVPGWDCHGLPIEHQVDKVLGKRKGELSIVEIRRACREYANKFVDIQRNQFKRLGVIGDWERPYLTMSTSYVAQIVREFSKFVDAGNVYRGRKPIYWCAHCRTALAEAEVEYEPHSSPSIYVLFPLRSRLPESLRHLPADRTFVVIWTTTPWTLPANLAVAFHPEFAYSALRLPDGRVLVMAEERIESVTREAGIDTWEKVGSSVGRDWENLSCSHPFYDRASLCVLGDHVTLEQGTGCVHTAPGHGQEDFEVGLKYGLEVFTPVDDEGKFTGEAAPFQGQFVFDADTGVKALLREKGMLLKEATLSHSYPHCWRCKEPIIFRSTPQWFISMETNQLRRKALECIRTVQWIPPWGEERIYSMIENRPDWCISRQRSWGVPIVTFHCTACQEILLDGELIRGVADHFEKNGPDSWFSEPAATFLPSGTRCGKCGGTAFEKDGNILDVWFDSGVSFASVVEKHEDLRFPADMYLEGSDQHRGWFHSSLLASVGTRGVAPYRSVLTHGYVVDEGGKKMSKSLGNFIDPQDVISRFGAEIVRMWVAGEDYRDDIRISEQTLNRLADSYRKIRNTARFILGNLYDFHPRRDLVPLARRTELDRWALLRLARLQEKVRKAYRTCEFHLVYHRILDFCVVDMSSFYLDVLKEILYVSAPDSPARRSAQSTLYEILDVFTRLIAPILSFTSEEIWQHLPAGELEKEESVHLCRLLEPDPAWLDPELEARWDRLFQFRQEISRALEIARKEKTIGHALDAWVRVAAPPDWTEFLQGFPYPLRNLLIVSEFSLERGLEDPGSQESQDIPGLRIRVQKARGEKCQRCWVYWPSVGSNPAYPSVCSRCVEEMKTLSGREETQSP